ASANCVFSDLFPCLCVAFCIANDVIKKSALPNGMLRRRANLPSAASDGGSYKKVLANYVVNGADFFGHLLELVERERLRSVRERFLWPAVHFDHQAVGAYRDTRPRQGRNHVIFSGAVRCVHDYG